MIEIKSQDRDRIVIYLMQEGRETGARMETVITIEPGTNIERGTMTGEEMSKEVKIGGKIMTEDPGITIGGAVKKVALAEAEVGAGVEAEAGVKAHTNMVNIMQVVMIHLAVKVRKRDQHLVI